MHADATDPEGKKAHTAQTWRYSIVESMLSHVAESSALRAANIWARAVLDLIYHGHTIIFCCHAINTNHCPSSGRIRASKGSIYLSSRHAFDDKNDIF